MACVAVETYLPFLSLPFSGKLIVWFPTKILLLTIFQSSLMNFEIGAVKVCIQCYSFDLRV